MKNAKQSAIRSRLLGFFLCSKQHHRDDVVYDVVFRLWRDKKQVDFMAGSLHLTFKQDLQLFDLGILSYAVMEPAAVATRVVFCQLEAGIVVNFSAEFGYLVAGETEHHGEGTTLRENIADQLLALPMTDGPAVFIAVGEADLLGGGEVVPQIEIEAIEVGGLRVTIFGHVQSSWLVFFV